MCILDVRNLKLSTNKLEDQPEAGSICDIGNIACNGKSAILLILMFDQLKYPVKWLQFSRLKCKLKTHNDFRHNTNATHYWFRPNSEARSTFSVFFCQIWIIFTLLELCLADAIHNFKWVEINKLRLSVCSHHCHLANITLLGTTIVSNLSNTYYVCNYGDCAHLFAHTCLANFF